MSENLLPLTRTTPQELYSALQPRVSGRVLSVVGLLVEGHCPGAAVGDVVQISGGNAPLPAEVVGLRDGRVLLVPLGEARGVTIGSRVTHLGLSASVPCSDELLGRVIDARGKPIDQGGRPVEGASVHRPIYRDAPDPLSRRLIDTPLYTGLRAIDGMTTLGRGQRIGIMAGAGVGKSTLLGTIAQRSDADVNVIALIGERGREVGEFIHRILSEEARKRTVLVVATSDQSPLDRVRGAFVATAIAEHFAESGKHVLLMMDSLTRFAMAQRELGLSMGEPPTTRGYTPSVFAQLPRLLERAGQFGSAGSITGVYSVLVEGDDPNDPIGDAARSILDGHISLSRALASRGHYPAIDVLGSISRVMTDVVPAQSLEASRRFRGLISKVREAEELLQIGAYVAGSDEELDRALQKRPLVDEFLQDGRQGPTPPEQTVSLMTQIVES
jgi:flagellum-specific ATP synthase